MTHEDKVLIMRAVECLRKYRRQTIQIEIDDNALHLIKDLENLVNRVEHTVGAN